VEIQQEGHSSTGKAISKRANDKADGANKEAVKALEELEFGLQNGKQQQEKFDVKTEEVKEAVERDIGEVEADGETSTL